MPWSLNLVVIISVAALPFEVYAASRISRAITTITSWPLKRVRPATFIIVLYPDLYPLVSWLEFSINHRVPTQRAGAVWDALLTYPFWCGIVIVVQISLILIAIDVASLLSRLILRTKRDRIRYIAAWMVAGGAVLTPVYCAYRIWSDMYTVKVIHRTVTIPGLPAELDGLKIAQITDVHVDNRTHGAKLANYLNMVNGTFPDLVLFCGDLISSGPSYIDEAAAALGQLKARYGVYACLGDHDYFTDPDLVARALEKNGLTVIRNAVKVVPVGGSQLSLTGVTNVYAERPSKRELDRLIALRPNTALDVFFTHQPSNSLVSTVAQNRYPLFIAGHTHGGQIVFPLPGFLLTGSTFETHYVTGFFNQGSTLISICNGLGMTLAPIRYQAPAEVVVIEVRAAGR